MAHRAPAGAAILVGAGLGLRVGAWDDIAPLQPGMKVDVGAALRAERVIKLAARFAAGVWP